MFRQVVSYCEKTKHVIINNKNVLLIYKPGSEELSTCGNVSSLFKYIYDLRDI